MSLFNFNKMQTRAMLAAIILTIIATSRLLLLNVVSFEHDEVRSVWRTFGSIPQIIAWQPNDWPPLYALMLGGWRLLVGFHPLVLRYSSILLFMLALAVMFRLARRISRHELAGWGAVVAYAGLGLIIHLSTNLRGYALVMVLFPAALWMTIRYFDKPSLWRALAPGLLMAAMFYTTYTSALAFFALGIYTLLVYRARIWRWVAPGALALLLVLPIISAPLNSDAIERKTAYAADTSIAGAVLNLFADYAGNGFVVFVLIFALATALILWRERLPRSRSLALLVWIVVGPVIAFLLAQSAVAVARYSWWVMPGIALWIGHGLAYLWQRPTRLRWAWAPIIVLLLALSFVPAPYERYTLARLPFEDNFTWISQHMEPGDVFLIDPECGQECGRLEEWDYYRMVYMPDQELTLIDAPDDHRRIWYLRRDGHHDEATLDALLASHVAADFIGPWNFLIQLYEAPPDAEGLLFDNGMRFHGYDVLLDDGEILNSQVIKREGESVRLRLWWSVDRPLDADYSVATQAISTMTETMLTQFDGPPQTVSLHPLASPPPSTTSQWEPGRYYIEERTLTIPQQVPFPDHIGPFTIYLTVYQWWDATRISAPGVDDDGLLPLLNFDVQAF